MNFEKWFEKQFGKEPSPGISLYSLWDEEIKIRIAEYKIRAREDWINMRKAALLAWDAKYKDKK